MGPLFAYREPLVNEKVRYSGNDGSAAENYNSRMKLRIRELRTQKNLTLAEFAELAGYGKGYVSEIERGVKQANARFLENAARVLGCSYSDLIAEENSEGAAMRHHLDLLGRLTPEDRARIMDLTKSLVRGAE